LTEYTRRQVDVADGRTTLGFFQTTPSGSRISMCGSKTSQKTTFWAGLGGAKRILLMPASHTARYPQIRSCILRGTKQASKQNK